MQWLYCNEYVDIRVFLDGLTVRSCVGIGAFTFKRNSFHGVILSPYLPRTYNCSLSIGSPVFRSGLVLSAKDPVLGVICLNSNIYSAKMPHTVVLANTRDRYSG
ncbi:hypothetical protein A0H81_14623 [Grifola frondosa]|uniref:Uncharacterized protein n=1 Tax=Grifola frondosa TaxID=5627 RepID=A0A1C7LL24_GRIFR|nr:hypothetical protein A0H81_14623 [Grifola frondosa]